MLDHATSEMAIGGKLGIDATKKLPGEGFKHPWPPLIKMDDAASSWKAILEFLETELRNRRENSTDK